MITYSIIDAYSNVHFIDPRLALLAQTFLADMWA